MDVDSTPSPPFVDRPWPQREPGNSPLKGSRILVVAHELDRSRALAGELARLGSSSLAVCHPDQADEALTRESWQAIVLEPGGFAPDLLARFSSIPDGPLLILGDEDLELSPALVRRAWASLPSPITPRSVSVAYGRAMESRALEQENRSLRAQLAGRHDLGAFVTRDHAVAELLTTARAVADTRATVLVLGESGTGKTLLARGIHEASSRAQEPFVAVNCGALPAGLLESELFGHVKGAFTGATGDKIGRFEAAEGGTLFLDEIDSAPAELQVKLLRVLQERCFERVGESVTRTADVRVIAATNADLEARIEAGEFREDLYWRLNVVSLVLPPLRERPGDVALLAETFVARYAAEHGQTLRGVEPVALAALCAFDWPGNVRQLENVIERAVLLSQGTRITLADLPDTAHPEGGASDPGSLQAGLEHLAKLPLEAFPSLREALEGPERAILVRALELTGGGRQEAAALLGINRSTLFNKMRKYDLLDLSFEGSRP